MNENRRDFFRRCLGETIGKSAGVRKRQSSRGSELAKLSDQEIGQFSPIVQQRDFFRIEGNRLLFQTHPNGTYQEVFHLSARDLSIMDHFDGQRSIQEISREISETFGFDYQEIYQRAKSLFVALTKCGICGHAKPPSG